MLIVAFLNRVESLLRGRCGSRCGRSGRRMSGLRSRFAADGTVAVTGDIEVAEARIMLSGLGPNPYAVADADPVRVENSLPHRFTVNYIDDIAIQVADIATGNIRVNGPNAYSEIAQLESVAPSSDPGMIAATFSVQPPGGTWDAADTLAYAIEILDLQVRDSAGTFIVGSQIGSFIVEPIGTGPDSFGYFASQTSFQFDNIRLTGAIVLPSVDDATFQLTDAALGDFQFSFYGTTYKSLFVSSNGLITFDAANATFTNGDLTANTQATIAPLWDDVMTGTSGVRWQVKGTGNQQQLIVQWDRARYFPNSITALTEITFQLVLSESDGSIQFNYLDLAGNDVAHNDGLSATVGIKDIGLQGTRRLVASLNTGPNAFVATGKSILIQRDTEGLWMPLGPFSATGGQTENLSPNDQISGAIHKDRHDQRRGAVQRFSGKTRSDLERDRRAVKYSATRKGHGRIRVLFLIPTLCIIVPTHRRRYVKKSNIPFSRWWLLTRFVRGWRVAGWGFVHRSNLLQPIQPEPG